MKKRIIYNDIEVISVNDTENASHYSQEYKCIDDTLSNVLLALQAIGVNTTVLDNYILAENTI
jgi:membrane-bound inhibitor of C-type lysozyme